MSGGRHARVNMPTAAPSRKVVAASTTAAVSGFVVWILGAYVFRGEVPVEVAGLVLVLVPGVLSYVAGYMTRRSSSEVDSRARAGVGEGGDRPGPYVD